MYSIRPILGYCRYGDQVTFSPEPERWFRDQIFTTVETRDTYILQFLSNLIISSLAFLAACASNMAFPDSDYLWAAGGPIGGLVLPFTINVLIPAYIITPRCWTARRAKSRSNKFILAPHMCQRELNKRVDGFPSVEERGWRGVLEHDHQMQEGGLLWGCPWKPTLDQVNDWAPFPVSFQFEYLHV